MAILGYLVDLLNLHAPNSNLGIRINFNCDKEVERKFKTLELNPKETSWDLIFGNFKNRSWFVIALRFLNTLQTSQKNLDWRRHNSFNFEHRNIPDLKSWEKLTIKLFFKQKLHFHKLNNNWSKKDLRCPSNLFPLLNLDLLSDFPLGDLTKNISLFCTVCLVT